MANWSTSREYQSADVELGPWTIGFRSAASAAERRGNAYCDGLTIQALIEQLPGPAGRRLRPRKDGRACPAFPDLPDLISEPILTGRQQPR